MMDRAFEHYRARVYLREAAVRRGQVRFHCLLLTWVANIRRELMRKPEASPQMDLFAEAIVRANYAEQARRAAA